MSTTTSGMSFARVATKENLLPVDTLTWNTRDAVITSFNGDVVFEQKGVRAPASWSDLAVTIVASKYLYGKASSVTRENGVDDLVGRVVKKIVSSGEQQGYFATSEDASVFAAELEYALLHQYGSFNSPVWFNVGCESYEPENQGKSWSWDAASKKIAQRAVGYQTPQCSACFINSVEDSLESILDLAKTEGMLFKWGSGSGSNLSPIRSSKELLAGGGTSSGPLSFMKGFDAFAGVIKSGGKTRRAAKMVVLDADHPDIADFIVCKGLEEEKARGLIAAGYDGSGPDSEAYTSVFYQNANNSVRVTDEFMQKATGDGEDTWHLRARTTGEPVESVSARALLRSIAAETWRCGDPGMQFDTTINEWHTSKASGRINASNPCSEYMFLDDSACNLASLNLLRYLRSDGSFDVVLFQHHVRLFITAQDILVDMAGYPTEKIARNSHDYRPLGLGYANLGALLMTLGLPYDSHEGRAYAAAVTSLMGGTAYETSAELAACLGPLKAADDSLPATIGGSFPGFALNRESFFDVIAKHTEAASSAESSDAELNKAAYHCWLNAAALGAQAGFRNAQVTVLAPTGTIGFMMDCATTGIEPMLGLIVYKKLVGGGSLTLVNDAVGLALERLGYDDSERRVILDHIQATGTVEGAAGLLPEHLPIFDCALKPASGTRTISYMGHIAMMAAVQPFLSGAISKTVNMPAEASVDEIVEAYASAWRAGLKAIAIYRDGSKTAQPMSVSKDDQEKKHDDAPTSDVGAPPSAVRNRLPDERMSITHKFSVGGQEGYITVGLYPNGQPGEIFLRFAKEGSTMSGLMDTVATTVSLALQHGVPLSVLCKKFSHVSFEPSGWTGNEEMGYAKSLVDYIFRWMDKRFLQGEQLTFSLAAAPITPSYAAPVPTEVVRDGMNCTQCGGTTRIAGKCRVCETCGTTSGGCS